ncbi:MAG: hypothetical protein ACRD03_03055, partial [Acidimicrobiales bacterium]
MDTERFERLVVVMAAMAAGDRAAVFSLYLEFHGHLAGFMGRELRRLGVENAPAEEVDGMVMDACLALFECGGAWRPDAGALPWTWAARRLAGVASQWVGQHADGLAADRTEVAADGEGTASGVGAVDDEAELDVLGRLAAVHSGCALVLEALEQVASRRDQAIVLELRSQRAAGDPSPANTVAHRHNVSPDVVRQAACRVRTRLARLAPPPTGASPAWPACPSWRESRPAGADVAGGGGGGPAEGAQPSP